MYTVWVGGTEVTDNYVTFKDASMLYDYYTERGHSDIIVQFEEVMMDSNISDGELLDLVYEWLEQKTEYELLTNPILNDLIKILKEVNDE